MSNVFSVHQRTCLISHTSAYVGAICRSVTGPLVTMTEHLLNVYKIIEQNIVNTFLSNTQCINE